MMRMPRRHWLDTLREYQERKPVASRRLAVAAMAPAPAIPGGPNWTTIGPSVIERGQALGRPSISGRVAGIAISADGQRIYVASANGGVWRSNDAGANWQSTMDSFDNDPTAFASTARRAAPLPSRPTMRTACTLARAKATRIRCFSSASSTPFPPTAGSDR